MRLVVQRVIKSNLKINQKIFSSIGYGILVFVGISKYDDIILAKKMAIKLSKLRIFDDENGKMNKSINDVNGDVLVVSQFTLLADTKRGNRPSFMNAAQPKVAIYIYEIFIKELQTLINTQIKTGKFGANMKIDLINDGPVTVILEN